MTVETRNPLPTGRYWIDVSSEPVPLGTFQGFLSAFKDSIHVESTEDDGEYQWFLFTTSRDLVWPTGIGYATIAGPEIKSRADTVQRPDPAPDFIDTLPTGEQLLNGLSGVVTLGTAGLALLIFIMSVRGRKS